MALRDRQLGGISLSWWSAFVLTIMSALAIPFIAELIWFKLFPFIPEGIRPGLVYAGMILHIGLSSGRVPQGKERIQLFFGMFTGVSFPAGIYLLPKLPFPFIYLILKVCFGSEVSTYFGWYLEGDISVASIVVKAAAEGVTEDGVRVSLSGEFIFEIENAAVYSSQVEGDGGKDYFQRALAAEVSSRMKQQVIAQHTVRDLEQGEYDKQQTVNQWVTDACNLLKDFGVRLTRSPIVKVDIKSKRIERAFDTVSAEKILLQSTAVIARQFALVMKEHPGISEESALILLNLDRAEEGLPQITMANIKMK
jgi:hypothetical protein